MNFHNCEAPGCEYRTLCGEDYCASCLFVMEHERAVEHVERTVFGGLWADEPPQDRLEAA